MHDDELKDRMEAGLLLSDKLKKYQDSDTIILAIPRGGVPVGYVIAKSLHLPLDIVLSKKIGHPNNKEFAIGAVSMNSLLINELPEVPNSYIEDEIIRLRKVMQEKYERYMGNRKPLEIKGKNVIVVDDGIATGNTLMVCINMLRKKEPKKIIVAVPVIPFETVAIFRQKADEFIYLMAPKYFTGVGAFYEKFDQVEDDEVIRLLNDTNLVNLKQI
ncbi:phosphoribosyltransferase [Flavobacterium psychrotolerans]|uniref:Phosphoribosyltransferase n=1 Tax=Flavobacterium psychrotolerans TaxID=2169410 RepID=A0A2U1JQZ5_9FLAO|nr:phosphoribosyltransferase family protein [Flavobacterium psychrotolerans]PWA07394.1 phosphoribosyltransferase [Flavobacterium psychrotolerans]